MFDRDKKPLVKEGKMVVNINKLFELNKSILSQINRIIFCFQSQNYDLALRRSSYLFNQMSNFMDLFDSSKDYFSSKDIIIDQSMFPDVFQELLVAQQKNDYILLSDLYEAKLAPLISQLQEIILINEHNVCCDYFNENIKTLEKTYPNLERKLSSMKSPYDLIPDGYSIEFTSGGDYTLAIGSNDNKRYLHSNASVWREAFTLANSWYNPSISHYIIYGLGLGYHIFELYHLNTYMDIEIYESDINIIQLATAFTKNIRLLDNNQIKLIYDPDFTGLTGRINELEEDCEFVIHYPSMEGIKNKEIKENLENYFIQQSSIKHQIHILTGNFRKNLYNYDAFVDELKEQFENKTLYIAAAGPSLDKNFMKLKDIGDRGIILATGTVFKKLMKAGITPDYMLVTDPNARVYKQIKGMESCDVPMFFLSTAYYEFAENYKGKRYVVCQKDYDKAEEFAAKNNAHCYRTGGSVSTTALDIGIYFNCRRIVFLGLDLAYTDYYAHAKDTSRRRVLDTKELRQVESITGDKVFTNKSLDMYRKWIEKRVEEASSEIVFIDATEGGAKIKGMNIAKLDDII